jgi:hypothetical protein
MSELGIMKTIARTEMMRLGKINDDQLRYINEIIDVVSRTNDSEIQRLKEIISEVHSWAVCFPIASDQDMAQNFPRIIEITDPLYPSMIDPEVPVKSEAYPTVECKACSEAAGAIGAIYHSPPACKG